MCFFEMNIMRCNGGVYQVSADTLKSFAEWIQTYLTMMPVERETRSTLVWAWPIWKSFVFDTQFRNRHVRVGWVLSHVTDGSEVEGMICSMELDGETRGLCSAMILSSFSTSSSSDVQLRP